METYENSYDQKNHFSFGKNWQDFLKTLDEKRISSAKESLVGFLGGEEKIKGKTFVDIGCGSGLFSLAAYLLGASKIVSVDVDEFSVACVNYLRDKENKPRNWEIKKGSALDANFINSLGKFDVVYSWGVLHHSGDMYKAFDNVVNLMDSSSKFYLAIYNRNTEILREGTSDFWKKIKSIYNKNGKIIKNMILCIYIAYFILGLIFMRMNPIKYIRNYKSNRGMSWHHDIIDWIGGFPYEYASPDEIINFFGKKNILCEKLIFRKSIGCSEYLLKNES